MPEFPINSFWSYRYVLRLTGRKAAYPPLGLLTFAGYLDREAWDLELLDLGVTSVSDAALRRRMESADVVFLSAMSIQKQALVDVLHVARGLSTPMVLGGPFASSYRDQILHATTDSDRVLHQGLDMLVWGEAQTAMPELLAWLDTAPVHDDGPPRLIIPRTVAEAEPGSRKYLNDRAIFRPLDVPLPRWDLARVNAYNSLMLQTTAGCPFRCDFCDIIQFNGGFSRPKPPAAVRRELEAILATGFRGGIFSVDDNFIGSPAATSAILDVMIEFQREHGYPFSFHTQASVNLGTPELEPLLEKMKLAGFEAVFLGIENPDEDALRRMNKKQNIKVDVPATVAAIQRCGIEVYGGFILGGDEDTTSTPQRIVDFVKHTRILTAMTGMLTPVPHTPLYERLRQEGRLRPAEFSGNNTDDAVQFEPAGMAAADLKRGIHEILHDLFKPEEAYRRALDMVRAVRPQIFNVRQTRMGELRVVAVSLWRQGVQRFDGDYFALLYRAWTMDRHLRSEARAEKRRLRRALRSEQLARALAGERARVDEILNLAHDYVVRFRPDAPMAAIRQRATELRERARAGLLPPDELRAQCEHAVACLRVKIRNHRFPGVKFGKAMEAAIKSLHYERVMSDILRAAPRPAPRLATTSAATTTGPRPR
jgi:radical SAM superfamily enzyme YgiQ (UPF0313 family)